MYILKALFVLFLIPIAIILRPLFFIVAAVGGSIVGGKGRFTGLFLLPIYLPICPIIVLYAAIGFFADSELGYYSLHDIFVGLIY